MKWRPKFYNMKMLRAPSYMAQKHWPIMCKTVPHWKKWTNDERSPTKWGNNKSFVAQSLIDTRQVIKSSQELNIVILMDSSNRQ